MSKAEKLCVEGCGRPAGTRWSSHWCEECDRARRDRITKALTQPPTGDESK